MALCPSPTLLSVAQSSATGDRGWGWGRENQLLWVFFLNPVWNHTQCTFLKMPFYAKGSKSSALTMTVTLSPAKNLLHLSSHCCRTPWFVSDLMIKFWYFALATLILHIFRCCCRNKILILFSTQLKVCSLFCDDFHPWRICFLGFEPVPDSPQTILSFISVLGRNLSFPSWDLPSLTCGTF